jgi:hypothetical protein
MIRPVQLFMDGVETRKPAAAPVVVPTGKPMTAAHVDDWCAVIAQARKVLMARDVPYPQAEPDRVELKRLAVACVGHAVFGPRGPSNPFTRLIGLSMTVAGSMIPTCHYADIAVVVETCDRLIAVWREGRS